MSGPPGNEAFGIKFNFPQRLLFFRTDSVGISSGRDNCRDLDLVDPNGGVAPTFLGTTGLYYPKTLGPKRVKERLTSIRQAIPTEIRLYLASGLTVTTEGSECDTLLDKSA